MMWSTIRGVLDRSRRSKGISPGHLPTVVRQWYKEVRSFRTRAYETLPTDEPVVNDTSIHFSRILVLSAIALNAILLVFFVLLVFEPVWMSSPGQSMLSANSQRIYVTGTTILASAITAFTVSQAKLSWLGQERFNKYTDQRSIRRARTILGIGRLGDILWYLDLTLSAIIVGLITSAIVAGVTLTSDTADRKIYTMLHRYHTHDDDRGVLSNSLDDICYFNQSQPQNSTFNWQLSPTQWLVRAPNGGYDCDGVMSTIGAAGLSFNPKIGYFSNGALVASSAIGSPSTRGGGYYARGVQPQDIFGLASPQSLDDGNFLESVTQCFPVLVRNPVKCTQGPTPDIQSFGNAYTINATVQGCSAIGTFESGNVTGGTIAYPCQDNNQLGQARIVISAIGAPAAALASSMTRARPPDVFAYAVVCTIDIAPAVELRKVGLHRVKSLIHRTPTPSQSQAVGDLESESSTFVINSITGNATCTPELRGLTSVIDASFFLTADALAAGASASLPLWQENANDTGWWPTLHRILQYHRLTLWKFHGAQNDLEDVLGVISGIALAKFWGTLSAEEESVYDMLLKDPRNNSLSLPLLVGNKVIVGQRIGSGSKWALLYALPVLYAILLFAHRLRTHSKSVCAAGTVLKETDAEAEFMAIPLTTHISRDSARPQIDREDYVVSTRPASRSPSTSSPGQRDHHSFRTS